MKHRLITGLFLLLGYLLPAQTDTTFLSGHTENAALERQHMIEASQYIFRQDQETRWALKWNVAALTPLSVASETRYYEYDKFAYTAWPLLVQLSGEYKITPAFSVNATLSGAIHENFYSGKDAFLPYWDVRVEPRWYYQMGRRVREGKQADNLSANYLGLESRYGHTRHSNIKDLSSLALSWGMQRRLFGWGYFDIGYGFGFIHSPNNPGVSTELHGYTSFYSQRRLQIGLAAFSPRTAAGSGSYCDALRCFQEDRQLLKTDLLNLLGFFSNNFGERLDIKPEIAFEQKIGASPFSVQADVNGSFYHVKLHQKFSTTNGRAYGIGAGAALQFRWYYTLRNRIARGRSGNNLSGLYAGLRVGGNRIYHSSDVRGTDIEQYGIASPVLGIQFRFLRHGYVDLFGGVGLANRSLYIDERDVTNRIYGRTEAVGGLRVGLAF